MQIQKLTPIGQEDDQVRVYEKNPLKLMRKMKLTLYTKGSTTDEVIDDIGGCQLSIIERACESGIRGEVMNIQGQPIQEEQEASSGMEKPLVG